ncbi:hypothetical protein [Corallococcus terminator]|uniref:hypothetical protein n=1 Tax=Corallococcus terminator TaxID=2316733 RepID=UPI0011C369DA|nr:hypothetical protein [Corallococcus terminator]
MGGLLVIASLTACQRAEPPATVARETSTEAPAAPRVEAPASAPVDSGTPAATDDHAEVNARITTVLGDPAKYEQAVASLQRAVSAHDASAVSAMVAYPFTASIGGKKVKIANAKAFIARYDAIVTPAVAQAITGQRYADLFVNAKGVMFGKGEAWLNGICKDPACNDFDVRVVALQPAP